MNISLFYLDYTLFKYIFFKIENMIRTFVNSRIINFKFLFFILYNLYTVFNVILNTILYHGKIPYMW